MRIFVDLSKRQVRALDTLAVKAERSPNSLIRAAVDACIADQKGASYAFGLWLHTDVDGLVYQERLRGEW